MARTAWTARRRRVFLETLRTSANVSASARASGASRRDLYRYRQNDPAFREDWDHALEEALDDLEGELRRRAVEGVEKPIYYGGKPCGAVRSYSDNLGMFLLKSRRPHVFASNGAIRHPDADEGGPDDARERLEQMLERLEALSDNSNENDDDTSSA